MGGHSTPLLREEAIPIPMHRVHTHEGLCSRIEQYRHTPQSSFSLPASAHHWLICQNAAGPKQLLLQADGREHDAGALSKQQIIYIPPFTKTEWDFSPADGSTHLLIPDKLILEALPDTQSFSTMQERGSLVGAQLPRITKLLNHYSKELNGTTPVSNLVLSECILNATKTLAEELTVTHSSRSSTEKLSSQILQKIRNYMWDNIDRNIKLSELASIAHLSPFHFSRLFKTATHVTPHQALIHARIQKARTLIPKSGSLTEIAYRCGFSDQAHFTRTFKHRTGYSPKQFRKMSA